MPEPLPNVSPEVLRGTLPLSQGLASLRGRAGKKGDDPEALRRASQEFEAVLVRQLIAEMRKSIPEGGFLERSMAREWFEGMLDQALAEEISRGRGLGLAEVFYEQMTQAGRGVRPSGSLPAARGGAGAPEKGSDAPPPTEGRGSYE